MAAVNAARRRHCLQQKRVICRMRRESVFRTRITLFDLNEDQIKHRYRLGSHIILELLSELNDDLEPVTQGIHAIPAVVNYCPPSRYLFFSKSMVYLQALKINFYDIYGFPNMLGGIDCTHVPLTPPAHSEHLYRNRKHTCSINVQVVCNCAQFSTAPLTNLNKN
ncbi:HARB1 nuclease, partial [Polyodon spathula]|nr:HARB1 nuclease [Polyodon spathula]